MHNKRLQRIFNIRPVEIRLYTYFGERVRFVPDDYTVDEEINAQEALELLRTYRNTKLAQCDWTQLPDVPFSDEEKEEWKTYRQSLRDFPQLVDVENWSAPAWPLAPGENEVLYDEYIFDYPPPVIEPEIPVVEVIEQEIAEPETIEPEPIVESEIIDSVVAESETTEQSDVLESDTVSDVAFTEINDDTVVEVDVTTDSEPEIIVTDVEEDSSITFVTEDGIVITSSTQFATPEERIANENISFEYIEGFGVIPLTDMNYPKNPDNK